MGVPQRDRIGPYELLLLLARGGMAELYLGRLRGYAGFDRLVAVKLILPHLATDKTFVEMFINEGRIAARLMHPNICQVTELCKDGDDLALAMEYLEGVGWDALVAVAPRDPRLVAGVLVQACEGLHHAHTLGVVHRDVSPQNLFVMTAGVCKVLDFGVSKIATAGSAAVRTRTGVLKGKLPYMAPEQIEGTPVDARADVWALGVILWEALAGRRLFDRESDFQIWKAITEETPPALGIPAIDRVIARALSRDRDARYATALELARDLDAAVGGAYRHTEIADTVRTRCADTLAALQRKIDVAVTDRTEPAPEASLGDSREAAETVSMLMRKDSVVMPRPRRRWWPLAVGAAIATSVVVVVVATRTTHEPVAAADPPPVEAASDAVGTTTHDIAPRGNATNTATPDTAPRGTATNTTTPNTTAPGAATPGTTTRGTVAHGTTTHGGSTHETATRGTATNTATPNTTAPGTATPSTTTRSIAAHGTTIHGGSTHDTATRGTPTNATTPNTTAPGTPTSNTTAPGTATPNTAPGTAMRATTAAAAPAATGTYAVDSTPYATIYVDGARIGDTPLDRVALPAGRHVVKAVLADGRHQSFAIDITADRKTSSGMLAW